MNSAALALPAELLPDRPQPRRFIRAAKYAVHDNDIGTESLYEKKERFRDSIAALSKDAIVENVDHAPESHDRQGSVRGVIAGIVAALGVAIGAVGLGIAVLRPGEPIDVIFPVGVTLWIVAGLAASRRV
jgi:hypothetical protein